MRAGRADGFSVTAVTSAELTARVRIMTIGTRLPVSDADSNDKCYGNGDADGSPHCDSPVCASMAMYGAPDKSASRLSSLSRPRISSSRANPSDS